MTQQVTGLVVDINMGNSQQRIEQMRRALDSLSQAGIQTAHRVQQAGDATENAGLNISDLSRLSEQLRRELTRLAQEASNTGGNMGGLSSNTQGASDANRQFSETVTRAADALATVEAQLRAARDAQARLAASTNSSTAATNSNSTATDNNSNALRGKVASLKTAYATVAGYFAAVAAGTAVIAAFTKAQMDLSEEITKVARLAGTSTDNIQKMTFGAQAVGIEMENFGDILKDVHDKVGDYLITGGGELEDFFENIAPKIGITAEQLRGLSSDEILQTLYNGMQQAGISMSEMTTYMEALASDASLLIPMLKDGGRGFELWYEAAKQAGAVMDKDTIKKMRELKTATNLLTLEYQGFKNQIASEFAPVMADLAAMFINDKQLKVDATTALKGLVETMKFAINTGLAFASILGGIGKGLGGLAAVNVLFYSGDFMGAWNAAKEAARDIADNFSTTNRLMGNIANLGTGVATQQTQVLAELTAAQGTYNKQLDNTNEKLIALTGNTAYANKNGSVHLDVRYAKEDSRYGKKVTEADLAKLLLNGKPIRQSEFRQTSGYGSRDIPNGSKFHKGYDFATPMETKVSTKVPVESIKSVNDLANGGGYVTKVTFKDGTVLNLLHLSPKSTSITAQYQSPSASSGLVGKQLQEAKDRAKRNADAIERDQEIKRMAAIKLFTENGGYNIAASNAFGRKAVDPSVLIGIMATESGGNPNAKSDAGALGAMQFMTPTAKQYLKVIGKGDLVKYLGDKTKDPRLDPTISIQMAKAYYADLLKEFNGNTNKAISAYNAGQGTVRSKGIGSNKENRDFLARVAAHTNAVRGQGLDNDKRMEINKAITDGFDSYLKSQQDATKNFDAIALTFKSSNERRKKAFDDENANIRRLGELAGKSATEIDTVIKKRTEAYDRESKKLESDLKQIVQGSNTPARQKNLNEYVNAVNNAPAELYEPARKKDLQTYLDNLKLVLDSKNEILDIDAQGLELEAEKAKITEGEYADRKYELAQRRIAAENFADKDLAKRKLDAEKAAYEAESKNRNLLTRQRLLSLKSLQTTQEEFIRQTYKLERDSIAANDPLRQQLIDENNFLEAQALKDLEINKQAKLLAIETVTNKQLESMLLVQGKYREAATLQNKIDIDNINKKWDLEEQRLLNSAKNVSPIDLKNNSSQKQSELQAIIDSASSPYISDPRTDSQREDDNFASALEKVKAAGQAIIDEKKRQGEEIFSYQEELNGRLKNMEDSYDLQKKKRMLSTYSSIFSGLTSLARGFLGEQSKVYRAMFYAEKAFNMASVVMNNWKALSGAWASAPFPLNLPAVAKTAAETGVITAAISAIQPQGFMTGGYTGGFGISEVAGVVHGQEYVLNARATRDIGVDTLNAINAGRKGNFGGTNVNIHNYAGAEIETRTNDLGDLEVIVTRKVRESFSNLRDPASFESRMVAANTTARPNML